MIDFVYCLPLSQECELSESKDFWLFGLQLYIQSLEPGQY